MNKFHIGGREYETALDELEWAKHRRHARRVAFFRRNGEVGFRTRYTTIIYNPRRIDVAFEIRHSDPDLFAPADYVDWRIRRDALGLAEQVKRDLRGAMPTADNRTFASSTH